MRLAFAVAFGVPVRRCPGKQQRFLWRPALARRSRELLPPEESLRRAKKRGGSSSALLPEVDLPQRRNRLARELLGIEARSPSSDSTLPDRPSTLRYCRDEVQPLANLRIEQPCRYEMCQPMVVALAHEVRELEPLEEGREHLVEELFAGPRIVPPAVAPVTKGRGRNRNIQRDNWKDAE